MPEKMFLHSKKKYIKFSQYLELKSRIVEQKNCYFLYSFLNFFVDEGSKVQQ